MNCVLLSGSLTRLPSTKFDPAGGTQTTTFTLAVSEANREGKPFTLFVGCVAFGRMAERCDVLQVGDVIEVCGKLTWQRRPARCGEQHSVLVVGVKDLTVVHHGAPEAANDTQDRVSRPVGW